MIKKKLWTKYYILIVMIMLFLSIGKDMLFSVLPLYAKTIGGNNTTAGLLTGVFTFSALLFRPICGILMNRKKRRTLLIVGAALFGAVCIFYSFTHVIAAVLALRVLQGFSFSIYTSVSGTIVCDITPEERLAEGIGLFGLSLRLA